MIERARRRKLADLFDAFASGLLTDLAFDDSAARICLSSRLGASDEDKAFQAILNWVEDREAWPWYLGGRSDAYLAATDPERLLQQCVVFLRTDLEYEWPIEQKGGCLLNLFTLGQWNRIAVPRIRNRMQSMGDPTVWPFLRKSDYEAALGSTEGGRGRTELGHLSECED